MTAKTVTCIEVECAGCGVPAGQWQDYDGPTHFPGPLDEALRGLVSDYGWEITELGEHLCPPCKADRACQMAGGHQWGPWRMEWRWCERDYCPGVEQREIHDVQLPADPTQTETEAVHP